jgi:Zn-finger nucleic acid-binding protein
MKCPIDGAELVVTERSEVEIDVCPVCRGVWLDRGELEKIVDRALGPAEGADAVPNPRGNNTGCRNFLRDLFDF